MAKKKKIVQVENLLRKHFSFSFDCFLKANWEGKKHETKGNKCCRRWCLSYQVYRFELVQSFVVFFFAPPAQQCVPIQSETHENL
jgi:hypothetical protein